MQWIVGHRFELCLLVICIGYWSVVGSLQWNVESTSKIDYEEASNSMDPNSLCSKIIYHDEMVYKDQIGLDWVN